MTQTPEAVNAFLKRGLELSQQCEKDNPELARQIIAYASKEGDYLIIENGMRLSYHPVVCYLCGEKLTNGFDIQFYSDFGTCPRCDSHRNDDMHTEEGEQE